MLEAIFWGGVLRVTQSAAQAAPFVITGFLIAAVFRRLVGQAGLRTLFGDGTWRSLPQAWGIGMLLPVCSLGVIPVIREMKRAGLSGGTILAFGLTAPLFNPLSVLYGLTLSEPFTIFAFMLASLLVVTCIGLIFDWLFPTAQPAETESSPASEAEVSYGIKRVLSVFITMGRDFWSWSSLYMLVGLSGILLLNIVLPPNSFQTSVNADNVLAPILMTAVAVPVYATPMLAMSQLGTMFSHGNSVGAAFALLILGAGVNFGIILWMYVVFGWKRASVWMAILLTVVLGLGYALEKPLFPSDADIADHTHAFDVYCRPYASNQTGLMEKTFHTLRENLSPDERFAIYGWIAIAVIGVIVSRLEKRWNIERWLTAQQEDGKLRKDLMLPNWVLGATSIVALIILSVAMCFAYYPPPEECLAEMYIYKGEVLSAAISGNYGHAQHYIPVWDDWNRRMQVGVYLRTGQLSDYHRMKSRVIRDNLELLDHAMDEEDTESVKHYSTLLSRAYLRLSRAYREEL